MGWEALIGLVVGGLIGILGGDDEEGFIRFTAEEKALGTGAILGIVGAVIGLIAGLSSTESDQEIQIEMDSDIFGLDTFAYYYFIYNETREKIYIEIQ